jgi:hypothetical protein
MQPIALIYYLLNVPFATKKYIEFPAGCYGEKVCALVLKKQKER